MQLEFGKRRKNNCPGKIDAGICGKLVGMIWVKRRRCKTLGKMHNQIKAKIANPCLPR